MRAALIGAGVTGARAGRQLVSTDGLERLVIIDADHARARDVAASLGGPATSAVWDTGVLTDLDVVVIATPADHRRFAHAALEVGAHVVSVADTVAEVRSLLAVDAEARERGLVVAVGAGFSPGLSCVLARHAAGDVTAVEEVHVAREGTGGPACARHHHRALAAQAIDWRDGAWVRRPGGSGRELCWFPDPLGGLDCYRAGLPDALLLQPAFPNATRVTARLAASRRDRLTARLPMLRRPHAEGLIGGIRVEVRGQWGDVRDARVLGALDRPAVGAGTVAAVAAAWAAEGRLARAGAAGLAELVSDTVPFLAEVADRGVRAAVFEGHTG